MMRSTSPAVWGRKLAQDFVSPRREDEMIDEPTLPDDVETGDATPPVAGSYLIRVTLRGNVEPPTNAQIEQAVREVLSSSEFTATASSERLDR